MIIMLLLIFLCLFILGVLFRKKIGTVNRKIRIVFFCILLILGFLSVGVVMGFIRLPIGIRHLGHLLFVPSDLYQPIVNDEFPLYEKGFTKTYLLKPKYLDFYCVGFSSTNRGVSSEDTFKGKIKAEFFWKDEFLFEKVSRSQIAIQYAGSDMSHYKKAFLMDFEMPLQGKYKDDISIRLTVLEPDEGIRKYGDSVKLFIGVSEIP